MVNLNIVAADDEDMAHRLTWPARLLWSRLPLDAKSRSSTFDGVTTPGQLAGTPEMLRSQLKHLVEAELRSRSRQLIAEAVSGLD